MPNWVYTDMTVIGPEKALDAFFDECFRRDESGRWQLDFNAVIPQPESEEGLPPRYIRKADDCVMPYPDKLWFNWYEWNVANWGTKWNACDCSVNHPTPTRFLCWFSTAWTAPEQIFWKLAESHPDLIFEFDWIEEQGAFGPNGKMRFKYGELDWRETYEDGSKEAYEHQFERYPADRELYEFDEEKGTYRYIGD